MIIRFKMSRYEAQRILDSIYESHPDLPRDFFERAARRFLELCDEPVRGTLRP